MEKIYKEKGDILKIGEVVVQPNGEIVFSGWSFANCNVGLSITFNGTQKFAGYYGEELYEIYKQSKVK